MAETRTKTAVGSLRSCPSPLVGDEERSAGQRVSSLGEEGRLEQAAHLIPVRERLRGRRGQPHRHPVWRDGGHERAREGG